MKNFILLMFLIAIAFTTSIGSENTYVNSNEVVQESFQDALDADLTVIIEVPAKEDNQYLAPFAENLIYTSEGYLERYFNPPDLFTFKSSLNLNSKPHYFAWNDSYLWQDKATQQSK